MHSVWGRISSVNHLVHPQHDGLVSNKFGARVAVPESGPYNGGIGRLVQLVRILGRHPRGRRFEFCTAHQNISKSEKGINGYDTANYNQVVGESLGAVWCSFARHKEENAASPRFFSSRFYYP
jgi:hypothetical protein